MSRSLSFFPAGSRQHINAPLEEPLWATSEPIKGDSLLNKDQIKHWTDVLKDTATGQFIFFGGKNLYLYSKTDDFDVAILGVSALIYLIIHVIIHLILSELED